MRGIPKFLAAHMLQQPLPGLHRPLPLLPRDQSTGEIGFLLLLLPPPPANIRVGIYVYTSKTATLISHYTTTTSYHFAAMPFPSTTTLLYM